MIFRILVFCLSFFVAHASSLAAGKKVMVLVPGAGGAVPIDFVVRNKHRFQKAGFETSIATYPGEISSAVEDARSRGKRVIIVAMSKGGIHTAEALARGARPHGVAFVSSAYRKISEVLGSPGKLPKTIIVHHRNDECPMTPARSALRFQKWARGKVRVRLITNRGYSDGRVCGPRGAHGFYRRDGAAVAAIIGFARGR